MKILSKWLTTLLLSMLFSTMDAQRPPLTPFWALGHIVWEDSLNTTEGAERLINAYLNHGVPVDAIIIDSPWTTCYNDFNWDSKRYACPENMMKGFSEKGVRTILWLTGNVNLKSKDTPKQKNDTYDEVVKRNWGVNNSQPYEWWKGFGLHIDFTNPEAVQWWYNQLDKVFGEHVFGWKVDQGEVWLPHWVETSKGTMTNEEFRHYYYDAMFDYVVSRKRDGVIIARPFSHQGGIEASVEKMQMGWCGDFAGNWDGLKLQIDNIYRSSQFGYGAVGCEVGGFFREKSTAVQLVRYMQFGCLTAFVINGGENGAFSSHLPWFHGTEIMDAYLWCVLLLKELAPYKFSTLVEANLHGGSLLKHTCIEEYSHLLGTDVFTKAIVDDTNKAVFHLPKDGSWIDFWDGSLHKAGELMTECYDVSRFPLFIRSGAIIPINPNQVLISSDLSMKGKRVFVIYPNGRSSRLFHLPKGDGVDYFDCTISYDEQSKIVDIDSNELADFVIVVKDGDKQFVVSGKGTKMQLRVSKR